MLTEETFDEFLESILVNDGTFYDIPLLALKPKYTGLKGCVRVTPKQHSAGPRVKYYNNPNCTGINVSILVGTEEISISNDTKKNVPKMNKKDLYKVFKMIEAYDRELTLYWYNQNCIDDPAFELKLCNFLKTGYKEEIDINEECATKIANKIKG